MTATSAKVSGRRDPSLSPQCNDILRVLRDRGSITNLEAQMMLKVRALPRRIADMEVKGYRFSRSTRHDPMGQRYVRYTLKAEKPAPATVVRRASPLGDDNTITPARYARNIEAMFDSDPWACIRALELALSGDRGKIASAFRFSEAPEGAGYWFGVKSGDRPLPVARLKAIRIAALQYIGRGYEGAVELSLNRVEAALEGDHKAVVAAFIWDNTPEGHEFWWLVYEGKTPIDGPRVVRALKAIKAIALSREG